MPDGSTMHINRVAGTAYVAASHRVALGSVQANADVGIVLAVDVTKVTVGTAAAAAASPTTGTYLTVNDHKVDGSNQALPAFVGEDGQITYSALGEKSGSAVDGTFTGIVAKRSGSTDVVKVTNGVFHGTVP